MMKHKIWFHSMLGFILVVWMTQTKAEIQNLEVLREGVETFIIEELDAFMDNQNAEVIVSNLDSRLRLKPCSLPIDYTLSSGDISKSRVTVSAKCDGLPWQVRIPVQIKRFAPTVFAANVIKRGDIITQGDLTMVNYDVSRLSRYYDDITLVVGQVAKSTIRQGQLVKPRMVKERQMVKRGEQVKIQMLSPGLNIQTTGIAMSHGVKNQTIMVKNIKSQRLIEATVTGPNIVRVNL